MRDRQKQRELKRKHREDNLDSRNHEGYFDPTPFLAVAMIRHEEKLSMKKGKKGTGAQ